MIGIKLIKMVVILVNINVNNLVLCVITELVLNVIMDIIILMANVKKFTMMAISEDLKFVMIII
jgi:hypothetical protein